MFPAKPVRLGPAMSSSTCHIFTILIFWCSLAITALPFDIDFQPPPTFLSQRDFEVNENDPIGIRVFKVSIMGGPVTFSISHSDHKDGSKYFRINETTGEVYLKESLKGLGGEDVYFYVVAHAQHNARLEFRVRVNKVTNYAKNAAQGNINNHGSNGNLFPKLYEMPRPNEKPKETVFNPIVQSSTTQSPPKKPPSDRYNNPRRNDSRIETMANSPDSTWEANQSGGSSSPSEANNSGLSVLSSLFPYLSLALIVPLLFILVAWIIFKCQRNVPTRNAIKTFSHKIINNNKSDSSETTISSFSSEADYNGALFRTKKSLACREMRVNSNKSLLKVSDNEWEFPRHHLKFIHILGEGCFGQVWKCEAINIGNTGSSQVVAVKTLKQNANQKEKEDLLEELDVMKMLEPHPNVVTLIGCCAEQDPVLLIMEFIPNGTLQSYLRQSRGDMNYGNINTSCPLTSNDLISFVYQIAKGMDYLSSKGIIHRDLAARNILVGYNKVCKIADFGFAKYDDVYERKSEGRLPIRWMAVESLTDFIFTTKSDVWSFGILMWEIVTLGWTPYPGFAAAEVIKKVCEGFRLEKPEHCKREIFNIMYYCWDKDPTKRPSFSELVSLLDNILYSENDYIELDRFPDHGYYNILKPGTTGEKL